MMVATSLSSTVQCLSAGAARVAMARQAAGLPVGSGETTPPSGKAGGSRAYRGRRLAMWWGVRKARCRAVAKAKTCAVAGSETPRAKTWRLSAGSKPDVAARGSPNTPSNSSGVNRDGPARPGSSTPKRSPGRRATGRLPGMSQA